MPATLPNTLAAGAIENVSHVQANFEALRDYINNSIDTAKVFRTVHTWTVPGAIAVPSGDTNYIPPFFVGLATAQTCQLVKARYRINSGTSATVKLQQNGADATGFTGISVTTTTAQTTGGVTLSDNDMLALIVTAVVSSPVNLSLTAVLEHSF